MYLIGECPIITLDERCPFIQEGGVLVEGERILAVGPFQELKGLYQVKERIQAKGQLMMPGLFIPHLHLYSTLARGLPGKGDPPRDFSSVLQDFWWKFDVLLNDEDIYYSALLGLLEVLKKGCVGVMDHHSSPSAIKNSLKIIASAVKEVGLRASLCYEVTDRHGQEGARDGIEENLRFIKEASSLGPSIEAHFGLHASMTLSSKTLFQCQEKSQDLLVGFHVHAGEGLMDGEDSQTQYGMGVVKRLDSYGIWNERSLAIHGVHLKEEELHCLKERDTMLVINPLSNLNNGVGMAPVRKMQKKGLLVGIGTDSCTYDPFMELKLIPLLMNHHYQDPSAGHGSIQTFLANNSKIFARFFSGITGRLRPGDPADLLLLNYQPLTPLNGTNFYQHLLFGLSGDLVDLVMAQGEILVRDGKLVSFCEEEIYGQSQKRALDLFERWERHV